MNVGDTFFFDGNEFSIKDINTTTSKSFPSGRVDASKFIGEVGDVENPRTIQRGRPRGFHFNDVAEALGEDFTPVVTSDLETTPEIESSWDSVREATTEEIKEVFSNSDSSW